MNRAIYITLFTLIFGLLATSQGDNTITVESFKKMSIAEQSVALEKAPSELKSELSKIHLHAYLTYNLGGEEGLNRAKENIRIEDKGLKELELFYFVKIKQWSLYTGTITDANRRAGMPHEKQIEVENTLEANLKASEKQYQVVHQLVFKLKPSPEALDLNKIATTYLMQAPDDPNTLLTIEALENLDKEGDKMYEEMKKLPTLTPEEIQKEYDAVPDEKVPVNEMDVVRPPSH
jgi:hypothetical protein